MNYEIAKIDAGIMLIDNYIERIEGEFLDLFETDAHNHFENIVMEECKDIIEYNYFLINRDLVALKKKLYRYKTYIYCGSFKVS